MNKQLPYSDIIIKTINSWIYDVDILSKMKKEFAAKHKLSNIPSNIQLLKAYRDCRASLSMTSENEEKLMNLLRKRGIRSQSGIVSVQVLTKPRHCPGKCIFCPDQKDMPKSYIRTEPWAMRAALNNFDPIKQVYNRLLCLVGLGMFILKNIKSIL